MGAVNGNNTDKSTEPVYREECKTFVKNNYNIKVSLAKPTGGNKNDIPVEEKKSVRVQVRNMSDNNGLQYSASDAVEQRTRKESPSITEREKVVPRPVPEPRQSPQGERQAVAPVPKARTMLPANSSPKNEPAGYGSRSQNAAPASQQNSSPMALPRSTKSHAAPPVPMPRTSGSTSATVGRGDSAQETSGYPDSFQKRRSRGSREITEEEFSRVYKEGRCENNKIMVARCSYLNIALNLWKVSVQSVEFRNATRMYNNNMDGWNVCPNWDKMGVVGRWFFTMCAWLWQ